MYGLIRSAGANSQNTGGRGYNKTVTHSKCLGKTKGSQNMLFNWSLQFSLCINSFGKRKKIKNGEKKSTPDHVPGRKRKKRKKKKREREKPLLHCCSLFT